MIWTKHSCNSGNGSEIQFYNATLYEPTVRLLLIGKNILFVRKGKSTKEYGAKSPLGGTQGKSYGEDKNYRVQS